MRAQSIIVRLGSAEWRVRPLTLKQIQEIEPLLRASGEGAGQSIATAIKIIAVALLRDHPDATKRLDEIEADARDIGAAMGDVLRLGGFIACEGEQDIEPEQTMGEAKAGADLTSASSTPA